MKRRIFLFLFTFYFLLFTSHFLHAAWPTTPDSALFVDFGLYPYLAVDETDESIMVIYIRDADRLWAKKYDRHGDPLWGGNAVVLADTNHIFGLNLSNLSNQWGAVVSDDSGGAIVCWQDFRNSTFDDGQPINNEIYLQRVDVNGQVRYGINGRRISGPASEGWHIMGDLKPDYHEGFIVGLNNDSTSSLSVLKRYNVNGTLLWKKYFDGQFIDIPATDRQGNIFVNTVPPQGERRQKLDLNGNSLWPDTLNGIIPDSREYRHGGAFSDGEKGAIGIGPGGYLTINRVDSTGQYVFGPNGIDLGEGQFGVIGYALDEAGGVYVSWTKNGSRLQRITIDGIISFAQGGVIVAADSITLGSHSIVPDGYSGIISQWADKRHWPVRSFYTQRIDSTGEFLWDSGGIEFHSTSQNPFFANSARPYYSDERGGALYVWVQQAAGFGARVMLKQISRNGILGEVLDDTTGIISQHPRLFPDHFKLYQNYPNPFNSSTIIRFNLSTSKFVRLRVFNLLGQEIKSLIHGKLTPGNHEVLWEGKNDSGAPVASGIYLYRLSIDNQATARKMLLLR